MIDSFSEHLLNESVLYFAPTFREKLDGISSKSEIARSLLELEGSNLVSDVTFISIDNSDYINFRTMKDGIEKVREVHPNARNIDLQNMPNMQVNDTLFFLGKTKLYKSQNKIKIGRFVRKVFPTKFNDSEVEKFVNLLKSSINSSEEIKVVSGDDIKYWYSRERLVDDLGGVASSCMVDKDYLDIYTKNPETCSLVIMTQDNKLIARALLWKLKSSDLDGVKYYMDRVYYRKDYYANKMFEYAELKGWCYKDINYRHINDVIYKGSKFGINMSVKVKKLKYDTFPYMDTFKRYDWATGILYNDQNYSKEYRGHILGSTSGGHEENTNRRKLFTRLKDYIIYKTTEQLVLPQPIGDKL